MSREPALRKILADWVRKELKGSPLEGPHVAEVVDVGLCFDPASKVSGKSTSASISTCIECRVGRGVRWHWNTGSEGVAGSISSLLGDLFAAAKLTAEDLVAKEEPPK